MGSISPWERASSQTEQIHREHSDSELCGFTETLLAQERPVGTECDSLLETGQGVGKCSLVINLNLCSCTGM